MIDAAIARSRSSGAAGGTSTSGPVRLETSRRTWEMWIWLCPNVRGICALTSRKNGTRPISAAT